MVTKYFGSWSAYDEVQPSWLDYGEYRKPIEDFPSDDEILFASYGGASYEGDAVVIYERNGRLYEVHGGHCSCNGLEDQWSPEETSWGALALRDRTGSYPFLCDHDEEARAAYWALVDGRTAQPLS